MNLSETGTESQTDNRLVVACREIGVGWSGSRGLADTNYDM